MHDQLRREIFSIFSSLTFLFQSMLGFFIPNFAYADPTKITAKSHEGQKSNGEWTGGNITEYAEGDSINFRFVADATHGPTSGFLEVTYTENDGTCLFFDGSFVLGTVDSISGSQPTVTTVGSPTVDSGEWVQLLSINYPDTFGHSDPNGVSRINYTLKLSNEASECSSGSPQHSRLNPSGGSVEQSGAQNVPIPANQVIDIPNISVVKNVDEDGDGSVDRTATAGEWSFTLDGSETLETDANGQVVFLNVSDGTHTINESGPGGYSFAYGTGDNCEFLENTATATVASGTTATNASCTFTNTVVKGSITVAKVTNPTGVDQTFDFDLGGDASGSTTLGSGG